MKKNLTRCNIQKIRSAAYPRGTRNAHRIDIFLILIVSVKLNLKKGKCFCHEDVPLAQIKHDQIKNAQIKLVASSKYQIQIKDV